MPDEIFGFYKKDVERIKAAIEFVEVYGAALRKSPTMHRFGTSDSVNVIEGVLAEHMAFLGPAKMTLTFPINNETTMTVWGRWFSERKGRRVAVYYDPFFQIYVAFAKVCIEDESEGPNPSGDDPSPDPHLIDPGPPENCPINWCKYTWNGSSWEFSGSVGCSELCPEYLGPPPEEGQSYFHYECCPINPPPPGAPMLVEVPDDFGVFDPTLAPAVSAAERIIDIFGENA